MKGERVVAGLSCGEVLGALSDYLDDSLPAKERKRIEEHLRGCDLCERFGGRMAGLVRALRTTLAAPPLDPDVEERLRGRLRSAG